MRYGTLATSCSNCECRNCLFWWKSDCPNGMCFDDLREKTDPYTNHYPRRSGWSNADKPREQEHWCRRGDFYPVTGLPCYIPYKADKTKVEPCFGPNIVRYQDGSIKCCQVETVGCKECVRRWEENIEKETT